MKNLARFAAFLVALVAAASLAHAQSADYVEANAAPPYSSEEGAFGEADLDAMLAPIALYPDELLSQILMASTYPLEVVEAARWSAAHPGLVGQDAVAAVDGEDWDPSVKSLVAFPDVLAMMSDRLEWTQSLGEAFLAQQPDLMLSVQKLRRAAYDEGNLASSDEMVVTREGSDIALDSPSPERMYVPYYDPRVVYGDWWWPDAQPVYWAPWPGYYVGGYGFAWGLGIPLGMNFFFADFDWHRHHVRLHDRRPFYFHGRDHRPITVRNGEWRHDPHHRHGVAYQNPLVRRDFGDARSAGWTRGDRNRTRTPAAGGASPATRAQVPGRIANPVSRGPMPAAPTNPLTRAPAPQPRAVPNGGTGSFFSPQPVARPQISRPPAVVPQQAPQPVYVQPIARPQAVPQQQIARPQGYAPRAPALAPAPAVAPVHVPAPAAHGNAREEPAREAPPQAPQVRGR